MPVAEHNTEDARKCHVIKIEEHRRTQSLQQQLLETIYESTLVASKGEPGVVIFTTDTPFEASLNGKHFTNT